jgi:hypothetical protein
MKLIVATFLLISMNLFAEDCFRAVEQGYSEHNEIHGYSTQNISKNGLTSKSFKSQWKEFEAQNYQSSKFLIYKGLSLKQNIAGVDAVIVDRDTCEIVDVAEVYVE